MDEPIQHPTPANTSLDCPGIYEMAHASPQLSLLLIGVTALATAGSLMLLFVVLLR
jgi:hypothetical protein